MSFTASRSDIPHKQPFVWQIWLSIWKDVLSDDCPGIPVCLCCCVVKTLLFLREDKLLTSCTANRRTDGTENVSQGFARAPSWIQWVCVIVPAPSPLLMYAGCQRRLTFIGHREWLIYGSCEWKLLIFSVLCRYYALCGVMDGAAVTHRFWRNLLTSQSAVVLSLSPSLCLPLSAHISTLFPLFWPIEMHGD